MMQGIMGRQLPEHSGRRMCLDGAPVWPIIQGLASEELIMLSHGLPWWSFKTLEWAAAAAAAAAALGFL